VLLDIHKNSSKKLLVVTAVDTFFAAGHLLDELIHFGHCRNQTLIGSHKGATDYLNFSNDSTLRKLTEYQNMFLWAPIGHSNQNDFSDNSEREKYTVSLVNHLAKYSVNTLRLMVDHVENDGIVVLALLADEIEKATEHARVMLKHGSFLFHTTEILPIYKD